MTPERWREINELFHAAVGEDPPSRQRLLDAAAGTDPELAAEVQSLLAVHESRGAFLDEPAWAAAPDLLIDNGAILRPGTHAGPYRIVREIGRGGMGIVYEAEDSRLQRAVALKALPVRYTRDPLHRERLTREARAAAALSHPSIATIYSLDELDGALYLASELVRGETLREELRGGALPPDRLLRTLVELAAGLAVAHAAGIVHRDIKPENVIRCPDGRVKILDFGVARRLERDAITRLRLTQTGMAIGTPGYMAPEQLGGHEMDARADVFAFGVVGWELATGVHPFGATAAERLARLADMLDQDPPAWSGTAIGLPGLDVLLRRCMRRDPADRFSSGEELSAELRRLDGSATPAPTAAIAPARDGSLRWWQIHQAAVAAVVASMPVAVWFVRRADAVAGSRIFLVVLALSTVAVTIRLNLFFTSRVHRALLPAQRTRVYAPLAAVEALLGVILIGAAALVTGAHDGLAAVLVTLAVATIASLGIIEPATTAAAFGTDSN